MSRKRFTAEQIIMKLRETEVELAKGLTITLPDDLQSGDERLVKYAYSFKIEGQPRVIATE